MSVAMMPRITGASTISFTFRDTNEESPGLSVSFRLKERLLYLWRRDTGVPIHPPEFLFQFPSIGEFLNPEISLYKCYNMVNVLPVSNRTVMGRLLRRVSGKLADVAKTVCEGHFSRHVLVEFEIMCCTPGLVQAEELDGVLVMNASGVVVDHRARAQVQVPKLEKVKYKHGVGLREDCAICIEDFREGDEIIKIPCSHIFHDRCFSRWIMSGHVCPLCRSQLPMEF